MRPTSWLPNRVRHGRSCTKYVCTIPNVKTLGKNSISHFTSIFARQFFGVVIADEKTARAEHCQKGRSKRVNTQQSGVGRQHVRISFLPLSSLKSNCDANISLITQRSPRGTHAVTSAPSDPRPSPRQISAFVFPHGVLRSLCCISFRFRPWGKEIYSRGESRVDRTE